MTVYVDDANIPARVPHRGRVIESTWCHLMADSVAELDAFAISIGMRTRWRQNKASGVHYDLTASRRRAAVAAGAQEISIRTEQWREIVARARQQYQELATATGNDTRPGSRPA